MAAVEHVRTTLTAVCLALACVAVSVNARAQDDGEDEIDYVALAARLMRDGHYDRAQEALREVDRKAPDLDRQRLHTLEGLLALKQKEFAAARKAFAGAIAEQIRADQAEARRVAAENGKAPAAVAADPALVMYLAQSNFGLKDYEGTLKAIARGGKGLLDEPSVFLMRAQSHWELNQPGEALLSLREGAKAFPADAQFLRLQVFFLMELGLYQEAMDVGRVYLGRAEATAADYTAVGEALRRGKQLKHAATVLEGAHLRFVDDETLMLALAHVYLDLEQPLSAAMLLEQAARIDPKFTVEAAELYKRAGRLEWALYLNARVVDPKEKYKQRLAILLALERFELVAAMADSLSRVGLLEDDNVRYALAYGCYKIGEFAAAERYLKQITTPELFAQANQLRKAMETCRSGGWECI